MAGLMDILSGAGAAVDAPGAAIRHGLAGRNPLETLANPFSWEGRTTGRDLLRQYGFADSDDTWGNYAGGMGVEMLSDLPATLLTGGLYGMAKGAGKQTLKSALRPLEGTARQAVKRRGTIDPTPIRQAAQVTDQQVGDLQKNLQRLIREQGDTPETAAAARALNEAHAASLKPRPVQAPTQAPAAPPAVAPREQMLQEGTELLSRNQPKQWSPGDLVGPQSTREGQAAYMDAMGQLTYSIGMDGPRKGKVARKKDWLRLKETLEGRGSSLQEKQQAAIELVSKYGEEARLRRMAVNNPGEYPLRKLRDRFGYAAVPVAAATGAQSLRSILRPEEA